MSATTTARRRGKATGGEDRLELLHQQITDGVASLVSSDEWRAMLDTAASFHHYSLGGLLC